MTVSLITDGRYVKLDIVRRYGDSPALTPRGWAQLAEAAAALVSNATSAWESMGAEPRGEA